MWRSCPTGAVRSRGRRNSRWTSCARTAREWSLPRRKTVVALSSTKKGGGSSASGSRKHRSAAPTDAACVRQIGRWLGNGFTGCGFAQSFANSSHILLSDVGSNALPEQIDEIFETASSDCIPGVAVFPAIRTEEQLIDQLQLLAKGSRWTLRRVTAAGLTTDDLLLGLEWKTSGESMSLPMGFGPFVTMPATRRAPYVCIATWPGGRANPHRKRPRKGIVDFLDSALPKPLSDAEYKVGWEDSVKRTGELLSEQGDDPNYYREVAFRLSATAAQRF
jgi:hypothetical protein